MELVRYNLRRGRLAVENYGPLAKAANDINRRFARGQRAEKALQASYQSSQARVKFKQTKKLPEWRLVYMLLDAGVLCPTAANANLRPFVVFEQAVFYIGKGTVERPFKHLEEARDYLLKADSQQKQLSDCALRIADIWRDGHGVVVLPVIIKLYDDDAKGREAAIISLKRIGLTNLVNTVRPKFPQLANVSTEDWAELGVMELIKAFRLYKKIEAKCCYPWDIPSQIDEIELWYGVCRTPYRSALNTPSPHIQSPAGLTEGFSNLPTPNPPTNAKEWHASISQDLRNHLVGKLTKAIFPSPDPSAILDQRIKDLISYARKVENEVFEVADDEEAYYHMVAEKIYKIQQELQASKDKRLTESRPGEPAGGRKTMEL
ncbi:CRE-CBP-1 protein [Aphelenchoides avenae]|nr:CRE-CBP-1 protein [Aphelenchus avenae]